MLAVVSCPAMNSVIASSRSWRVAHLRPLSSSWACRSIESRSPRSSPVRRRSAIMPRMIASQPLRRAFEAPVQGRRQPDGDRDQRAGARDEVVHERFHRRRCVGRVAADLGVEQRLGDDLKGQPHQVVLDVARLAGGHDLEHPLGVVDHDVGVRGDPVAVEGRLRQLPLSAPEVPLAGQQAVSQRPLGIPKAVVLDELPVLIDEHLLDQVGMVDEPDRARAEPHRDDVAVLPLPARERRQPIATELPEVPGEPLRLRPRG